MNSESRTNMIKQQLRTGGVINQKITDLFDKIPRENFVPEAYKAFAYADMQIELPHQQRMMTPLEEGKLIDALDLTGQETVLEVGTGSGYLTALLSQLAKKVISIDCYAEFTRDAQQRLQAHNCHNVEFITDNAYAGWHDKAPYDVIIFSGGITNITEAHRLQLAAKGRLFTLLGNHPVLMGKLISQNQLGEWKEKLIFETNLPSLISKKEQSTFVF